MRLNIKIKLSLLLTILIVQLSNSQILYNNGAQIIVQTGADVMVQGSVENNTGTITNDGFINITQDITNQSILQGNGIYSVQGNWINNATFLGDVSNQNLVLLNGNNTQFIQGTAVTTFYNLELTNGTLKKMFINAGVNNNLILHNQELATDSFIMYVYNTDINAVTRDNSAIYGFVSSLGNGRLSRNTNTQDYYLFPVGSSLGTLRYRPVSLKPENSGSNTFAISMVNNDANNDGFSRNTNDGSFCQANPGFYHKINRTQGTSSAEISIYYNETEDGAWLHLAYWNGSQWNNMEPVTHTSATPFNYVTKINWNDFANSPYILVNTIPQVSFSGLDSLYCLNDSASILTGTPAGGTFSGTGISGNTFTPSTPGTYDIIYTYTENSCINADTQTVIVNDLTIASITVNNASCGQNDGSATVNASGGTGSYSYQWNTSPVQTSQTAQNLGLGTYTVTVNDGYCTAIDSAIVAEDGAPTVTVSANTNTLCNGDTAIITAQGADSYTWSPAAGLDIDTGSTVIATPLNSTTYTVTGTTAGCSAQAQITINVNTLNIDSVTITNEICSGSNGSILLSVSGGTGVYNYSWNTNPTQTSNPATNLTAGTYSVTVDDGECFVVENNINLADSGNLQINVSRDTTICLGESVNLYASGADTYNWSPATGLNTTTGNNVIAGPSETTTYQVVGVSGACSDTAYINVNIDNIKVSTSVVNADCGENNGSATAIVTGGTGNYTYQWNTSPSQTTATASNLSAGNYTVTVTDDYCSAEAIAVILENGTPQITVTADQTNICNGSSTTITAQGANTYHWYPSNTLSSDTGSTVTAEPAQTTTYVVTASSGNCSAQDSITITVSETPEVTFRPNNPTICQGENVTVEAGTGNSYYWADGPGIFDNTSSTQILSPNSTHTYYVTVSNGNCSASGNITVNVNPLPDVNITASSSNIVAGQSVVLTASGAQSYTWSPTSSLSCSTCNPVTATPDAETIYYVYGTGVNGCVGQDTILIRVSYDNEIFIPSAFSPNNDNNNDVLYVRGRGIKKLYFAIYNRWGELVFETKDQSVGWDGTYKGKELNSAVFVYYVQVTFYDNQNYQYKGSATLVK